MKPDYIYAIFDEWADQGTEYTENTDIRNADKKVDNFIDKVVIDSDENETLKDLILFYVGEIEVFYFQEGFKAAIKLLGQSSI